MPVRPLEIQRQLLPEFSQSDKALTRRGLLLPDPCSLAYGIAEKQETAPGAWLGSRFEAHNNDMVRSSSPGTSVQLSPGLDTEEIKNTRHGS